MEFKLLKNNNKAEHKIGTMKDVKLCFHVLLVVLGLVLVTFLGVMLHQSGEITPSADQSQADGSAASASDVSQASNSDTSPYSGEVPWLVVVAGVLAGAGTTFAFRTASRRLEEKIGRDRQAYESCLEQQSQRSDTTIDTLRAELKSLRENEQRFRSIVENSNHGIIVHRNGRPLFANPATADMLGYAHAGEILSLSSITDFVYEDDVVQIRNLWTRRMQGEEAPGVVGYRLQRRDGTVISVEVRPTVIEWDGEPAVLAACYDITEQKSGEYAVRESAARLRRLIETIPYGVQETNIEGTITFTNPANAAMFGYEHDEMVGKKIWDLAADEQRRIELEGYFSVLVEQQPPPRPFFGKCLTKDGRKIHVRIDWSYIRSTTDHLLGFTAILTDITEGMMAQRALEQSEAHFRNLAEASVQGITVVQENRLVFANTTAARMLGYDNPAAFLGHDSLDLMVHPDDRALVSDRRAARLRGEDVPQDYRLRLVTKDGRPIWIEILATIIEWGGRPATFSIYHEVGAHDDAPRSTELADLTI